MSTFLSFPAFSLNVLDVGFIQKRRGCTSERSCCEQQWATTRIKILKCTLVYQSNFLFISEESIKFLFVKHACKHLPPLSLAWVDLRPQSGLTFGHCPMSFFSCSLVPLYSDIYQYLFDISYLEPMNIHNFSVINVYWRQCHGFS